MTRRPTTALRFWAIPWQCCRIPRCACWAGTEKSCFPPNVQLESPALTTGGGRAAAYGVGGTVLYILDEKGLVKTFQLDEEEPLIAASLNHEGWLAVTAEKKNYKACVSVYNQEMEKVFDFNSSRRFVSDACVTDDCGYLAAVTLGQETGHVCQQRGALRSYKNGPGRRL